MEIWKDIKDYEGFYQVSNIGNVRSLDREFLSTNGKYLKYKGKNLKNVLCGEYFIVNLYKFGNIKTKKVHQLVAEAFLNHTPCGFTLVVNHINFNKQDNRVVNLEIVTARENGNRKHLKSKSSFTGVQRRNNSKKWMANILINGKNKYLGLFKTEEEASLCYENALLSIKNVTEIIVNKANFSSKHKGVSFHKGKNKWISFIIINRKTIQLGAFLTEYEAFNCTKKALSEI